MRDPWTLDRAPTAQASAPRRRRAVFGYVYELVTGDPRDGEHPYVGQTTTTIHQRVHGPSGHTSPGDIAKDPWKARILPGKAGYRQLEVVYDTGDQGENERALNRAEAYWIDAYRTTHNTVRPVRPPVHQQPAKPAPRKRPARRRASRIRPAILLTLVAAYAFLVARVVIAMQLPWPQAPWIVTPVGAFAFAVLTFGALDKHYRRMMGHRR